MEDFKKKIPNASDELKKAMENIQRTMDEKRRREKTPKKVEKTGWISYVELSQPERDRKDDLP